MTKIKKSAFLFNLRHSLLFFVDQDGAQLSRHFDISDWRPKKRLLFLTFQATEKKHSVFENMSIFAEILPLDVAKTLFFTAFSSTSLQPQPVRSKKTIKNDKN